MKKYQLIEIGGTHLRIAKAEFSTQEINISKVSKYRTKDYLNYIPGDIFQLVQKDIDKDTNGMIFAVAGPVKDDAIVESLPNIHIWPKNYNLKEIAQQKFGIPVMVKNDMDTATKGMAYLAKIDDPFWGVTWSTGLGARYWDGKKTNFGELGHEIKLKKNSQEFEAEDLLGGNHLKEYLKKNFLDKIGGNDPIKALANGFESNEEWARKVYYDLCLNFVSFLSGLLAIKKTEQIVLKGAIADFVLSQNELKAYIENSLGANLKIIISPDSEKDSFYGAVLLFEESRYSLNLSQ